MAIEIERKFLVVGDSWRTLGKAVAYRQGYLSSGSGPTVRVRVAGDAGYLTVKGASDKTASDQGAYKAISRAEFEYTIPISDAAEMLDTLCDRPLIEKLRYRIPLNGLVWEIDEFAGANQGLVMAEVELTDPYQIIQLPEWIGTEVSDDSRYFNSYLAKYPYREWGKQG